MFPLDFPLKILLRHARPGDQVLDPFCGRGTTNFAARLLGLSSTGIDASPVAAAITAAKLVKTDPYAIVSEARAILDTPLSYSTPSGEFWELAYHPDTLKELCQLRSELLRDCSSPARIALRAIILGALHGPRPKTIQSYFSNQCPRTYAPKPAYATRFWTERGLSADRMDVVGIIQRRAERFFADLPSPSGQAVLADSRSIDLGSICDSPGEFAWIITSPPYYGMRTYIPDQWLRNWFVGGPSVVDYSNHNQIVHKSPIDFADDLKKVWRNVRGHSSEKTRLVVCFGGLADRRACPRNILRSSLRESGWRILTVKPAGDASLGRRQANTFLRKSSDPIDEHIVWAAPA
jgi:hypothetical protein